jgi:4'-phosphopantetheinyl transferase
MSHILTLHDNTLHLWRVDSSDYSNEVSSLRSLLSPDELARADRFRFDIHRERFTIIRAFLRKTIGLYLGLEPQNIRFSYGEHGKPFLLSVAGRRLYFNISHSEEFALFAFMRHQEVGIDIEKIRPHFKEEIAKRFFSEEEYENLMQLPEEKRVEMFYEYWSRKEAILKTHGTGLFREDAQKNQIYVESIFIDPDYKAAFATWPRPKIITHLQWVRDGYITLSS